MRRFITHEAEQLTRLPGIDYLEMEMRALAQLAAVPPAERLALMYGATPERARQMAERHTTLPEFWNRLEESRERAMRWSRERAARRRSLGAPALCAVCDGPAAGDCRAATEHLCRPCLLWALRWEGWDEDLLRRGALAAVRSCVDAGREPPLLAYEVEGLP